MRLTVLAAAIALSATLSRDVHADDGFTFEKVDSTGAALATGVLCATPSGDLVATDVPYYATPAYFLLGHPTNDRLRIVVRHDGVWTLHEPAPPQDSTISHDLACGPDGRLHLLTYQAGGLDECRPILEDETPSGWETTVLDTGRVLSQALALDSQGQPWVAMLRLMRSASGSTLAMIVAHRTDQGWARDSLDLTGATNAYGGNRVPFLLDPLGRPQFLLLGPGSIGLLRATRDEAGWQVDSVDAQALPSSVAPAFAISPDGVPHVLYGQNSVIWYASLGPSGWTREPLPLPNRGKTCALAFDLASRPHVTYCTPDSHYLPNFDNAVAYGYKDALQWSVALVHDDSTANTRLQLIIDANDRAILYLHDPAYRYPMLGSSGGVTAVGSAREPRPQTLAIVGRNPCRSPAEAIWSVTLTGAVAVSLEVFDVSGRCLGSSASQRLPAGRTTLRWRPPVPSPGCYLVSARVGGQRSAAVLWTLVR